MTSGMTTDVYGEKRSDKVVATVVTVAVHAIVVALMIVIYLTAYVPSEEEAKPEDVSELLLDGEYVMAGDIPEPALDSEPAPEHTDVTTTSSPEPQPVEQSPQPVAPAKESPMKVTESKPTISKEEQERIKEAERREAAAKEIARKVNFGKTASSSASGSGEGKSGQADGNAATGALSGRPAANLHGRTLETWENPRATEVGTIIVAVRVDRQGRVVSAEYNGGSGTVAGSASARKSCVASALRSKFSVDLNAKAEQTGTITYRFR